MPLNKEYFEQKVKESVDNKELSANLNNMLLFEILEFVKASGQKSEEVKDIEPVVHVNKGRKTTKG